MDEPSQDSVSRDNSSRDSISVNNDAGTVSNREASTMIEVRRLSGLKYVIMAFFVSLLSIAVIYLLNQRPSIVL